VRPVYHVYRQAAVLDYYPLASRLAQAVRSEDRSICTAIEAYMLVLADCCGQENLLFCECRATSGENQHFQYRDVYHE
jgi:hypothetical protein